MRQLSPVPFRAIISSSQPCSSPIRRFPSNGGEPQTLYHAAAPSVEDFSGLRPVKDAPVWIEHRPGPIGRVKKVWAEGPNLHASGIIDRDASVGGAIVAMAASAGLKFRCSMGVIGDISHHIMIERGQTVEINGREFIGPIIGVHAWDIAELSVCLAPEDRGTAFEIETPDSPFWRRSVAEIIRPSVTNRDSLPRFKDSNGTHWHILIDGRAVEMLTHIGRIDLDEPIQVRVAISDHRSDSFARLLYFVSVDESGRRAVSARAFDQFVRDMTLDANLVDARAALVEALKVPGLVPIL